MFFETSAAVFVISWIAVVVPPPGVGSGVITDTNPIAAAVDAAVIAIEPFDMDLNGLIFGVAAVDCVPLAALAAAWPPLTAPTVTILANAGLTPINALGKFVINPLSPVPAIGTTILKADSSLSSVSVSQIMLQNQQRVKILLMSLLYQTRSAQF